MFVVGQIYNRRNDIHAKFGGQRQGGISTPSGQPYIFLFTGEGGEAFGYSDGVAGDGTFRYYGEGQHGDMPFVRGNKAILEQAENGKSLLLFRTLGKGKGVRFMAELGVAGWEYQPGPDVNGDMRQAIVFKLVPLDAGSDDLLDAPLPSSSNLAQLRQRALEAAKIDGGGAAKTGSPRIYYERSKAVRDYVLTRAKGICENCDQPAPFSRKDGSLYLEPHHVRRVSDGGPDHPSWVAGVCPNCHREIHHGKEGDAINAALMEKIPAIENQKP
jgi:5-methylcytosine-specific restriction enzyme A